MFITVVLRATLTPSDNCKLASNLNAISKHCCKFWGKNSLLVILSAMVVLVMLVKNLNHLEGSVS